MNYFEEEDKSPGRLDKRYYYQLPLPKNLAGREGWTSLKTLGAAMRVSEVGDKRTIDTRFYERPAEKVARYLSAAEEGGWGIG